jgi:hypothetical protein
MSNEFLMHCQSENNKKGKRSYKLFIQKVLHVPCVL